MGLGISNTEQIGNKFLKTTKYIKTYKVKSGIQKNQQQKYFQELTKSI